MTNLADITAVILAGGLGTRLRPVVADRPKVLAEVRGRPSSGLPAGPTRCPAHLREAVLCTGYLGDRVQNAFGEAYGPMCLLYSQESSPKGTAGALRLALPLLRSDPVLVMNGDSYCHADLKAFLDWHQGKGARASMLLVERVETGRYGRVHFDGLGLVNEFVEKERQGGPGWINAGIYLIQRSLLQTISANGAVSLEREIFPSWIGQRFYAYCSGGSFLDMGTPEAYAQGESFFDDGKLKEISPEELDAGPFSSMVETHLLKSAEIKRRTQKTAWTRLSGRPVSL